VVNCSHKHVSMTCILCGGGYFLSRSRLGLPHLNSLPGVVHFFMTAGLVKLVLTSFCHSLEVRREKGKVGDSEEEERVLREGRDEGEREGGKEAGKEKGKERGMGKEGGGME